MTQNGHQPKLKAFYREKGLRELMDRLSLKNPWQAPRLEKIVINVGVSEAKENIQVLDTTREELSAITGQTPQVRRSKKSISNFKLREGMPIGLRVTLRGDRMYEFLDRLISMAIPRLRDFRGLDPDAFDGHGNYNLGIRERQIFPEVSLEKSVKLRGMNITLVTTAKNDDHARQFLAIMGMPFKKAKEGRS